MKASLKTIIEIMEEYAPPALAEKWDNPGLQLGSPDSFVKRVLLSLDMDEKVLGEALKLGADLVITHHPLFFREVKQIRLDSMPGRLLAGLIRAGVSVFSAHTNLDSASGGVSAVLAKMLGLAEAVTIAPGGESYLKLVVFVPYEYADKVRGALSEAGAGWIGNYSECTFMLRGTGTFRPLEGANPFTGKPGELEKADETRLETILPSRLAGQVVGSMLAVHPYEEVAYDLYPLENSPKTGLGRIGRLQAPLAFGDFTESVRTALQVDTLRCGGSKDDMIRRVAVCGGAGADLWARAQAGGADVLVTGDVSYHAARDMLAAGLKFIDAGHYETERVVLEPLAAYLKDRFGERGLDAEVLVSREEKSPFWTGRKNC